MVVDPLDPQPRCITLSVPLAVLVGIVFASTAAAGPAKADPILPARHGSPASGAGGRTFRTRDAGEPVRVGVLHSLTGTMAISERSLVDAIQLAIGQVNAAGGVLEGRRLVPVVEDGASDEATFARKAERLILRDRVVSIFGCWTSAARKAVLPVLARHDHLLWYPVQYEGFESSPHVIYTGAAPNQQVLPALDWCVKQFGPRAFLVGSDYVFPRTANRIVKARLAELGARCAGETYRPLGDRRFGDVVRAIREASPDFVLSTINGDSNVAFFGALSAAGLGPDQIPVLSVSVAEDELRSIGPSLAVQQFCAWSYFQSLDTPANRRFVAAFKRRFGAHRVTDDPIEAAYFQVKLFAAAVRKARSTEPRAIRQAARGLTLEAPGGTVRVDPTNQHTWRTARIGQVLPDGQIRILWSSPGPIRPDPFPDAPGTAPEPPPPAAPGGRRRAPRR
jgi:urea transport system substrate-binding protein